MTTTAIDPAVARQRAEIAWKRNPGTLAHKLTRVRLPPIATGGGTKWEHYVHSTFLARKFAEAVTRPNSRQIWCLPPRHGKSLTASVWGPTWVLDLWPHKRIILGAYAAELAQQFGRDVRNILDAYPDHLRVQLRPDSKAAHRWNTPQGGGMLTAGFDGSVTGFGADVMVLDDPFKNWQEAQSKVTRETVWNTWLSTFRTRREPGCSIITVMTRWHEDDLVGRFLAQDEDGEGEGWELIRLPALAEADDLLGREPGMPLCPERFDLDELLKTKRTSGSYLWAGMYQQRPAPDEGGIFKRHWWQFWRAMPALAQFDLWVASWDMAFKDKEDSSYVVGQVWARRGAEKWLIDQVRGQMDYPSTKVAVRTFSAKWRAHCRLHLVEDKANGPAIIADLRREVSGLVAVDTKGESKVARARAASADAEAGNIYLPHHDRAPWVHDFIEEFAAFPNGTNDDQVDCYSQAIDRINRTPLIGEDGGRYEDHRMDTRR